VAAVGASILAPPPGPPTWGAARRSERSTGLEPGPPSARPVRRRVHAIAQRDRASCARLGRAGAPREAGQLDLALELGRQALGQAPGYPEAQSVVAPEQPQATAPARAAATAQATARQ
jgi:hypothetical protein